ncbi:MAG: Wzz/FepE/Etk N-terminal domain-containing protein [Flavobacteriales bacterium]
MTAGNTAKAQGSFDLVLYLWARRRTILTITLLAAVAGVVAAFVIKPRYKSEAVLFPAVTNSVSRALLGDAMTGRDDILALGDEKDAEQLMQVLNSDAVREHACARFDLMKAYGVDPNGAHRNAELREAFEDNVRFEYTRYGSVRVEVMDVNAQRAADIANFIIAQVDSVWNEMERQRGNEGVRIVQQKFDEALQNVRQLNDTLAQLRSLGIQDYHTQSERFNEYLGAAIVKGNDQAVRRIEDRFKVMAQYGGNYVTLQMQLDNEVWRASTLRAKLVQARADLDSDLPHTFVVNRAYPADKKSYPVRWLVVAISTISGLCLSLLLIVVQENIKKIKAAHA